MLAKASAFVPFCLGKTEPKNRAIPHLRRQEYRTKSCCCGSPYGRVNSSLLPWVEEFTMSSQTIQLFIQYSLSGKLRMAVRLQDEAASLAARCSYEVTEAFRHSGAAKQLN